MNRIIILPLCLIFSPLALGETFYGLGFTRLNLNNSSVEANATSVVMGYKLGQKRFTLSPQFRFIKTKESDAVQSGEMTLDDAFIFSAKAQYTFKNGTYFFTSPSLGNFNYIESSRYFNGKENSEVELGLNVGAGYKFNNYFSVEITADKFKNFISFTTGINFRW